MVGERRATRGAIPRRSQIPRATPAGAPGCSRARDCGCREAVGRLACAGYGAPRRDGLASARRIPRSRAIATGGPCTRAGREVRFERVSFSFDREPVLVDASFSVSPGEMVSLVDERWHDETGHGTAVAATLRSLVLVTVDLECPPDGLRRPAGQEARLSVSNPLRTGCHRPRGSLLGVARFHRRLPTSGWAERERCAPSGTRRDDGERQLGGVVPRRRSDAGRADAHREQEGGRASQ